MNSLNHWNWNQNDYLWERNLKKLKNYTTKYNKLPVLPSELG